MQLPFQNKAKPSFRSDVLSLYPWTLDVRPALSLGLIHYYLTLAWVRQVYYLYPPYKMEPNSWTQKEFKPSHLCEPVSRSQPSTSRSECSNHSPTELSFIFYLPLKIWIYGWNLFYKFFFFVRCPLLCYNWVRSCLWFWKFMDRMDWVCHDWYPLCWLCLCIFPGKHYFSSNLMK